MTFVTTKTPLAEWLEKHAAEVERTDPAPEAGACPVITRLRAAAYAIRRMTPEQEADMLRFLVGGRDGREPGEPFDNPVQIGTPPAPNVVMTETRPIWCSFLTQRYEDRPVRVVYDKPKKGGRMANVNPPPAADRRPSSPPPPPPPLRFYGGWPGPNRGLPEPTNPPCGGSSVRRPASRRDTAKP